MYLIGKFLCTNGRLSSIYSYNTLLRFLSSNHSQPVLEKRQNIHPNCTDLNLVNRKNRHLFTNGSVIISESDDIFENLSLEEWIYRNYDFSKQNEQILLLWHNRPSVVIGRHQNIWTETSVDYCVKNDIALVRRNSGGGAVYHDMQNLNISFITSRKNYNRKRNLEFIRDVLKSSFAINTEINAREDLVVAETGEKVSGTASKLNSHNSYHHCTLLVDVDRDRLRKSLRKMPINSIESNATKSVPSPVLNLRSLNSQLSIEQLIETVSGKYRKHFVQKSENQFNPCINKLEKIANNQFESIDDIRSMFTSWQWIFGKTPRFSIHNNFHYKSKLISFTLIIEKGLVKSFSLDSNQIDLKERIGSFQTILDQSLIGVRFDSDICAKLQQNKTISGNSDELIDIVSMAIFDCYQKCVQC